MQRELGMEFLSCSLTSLFFINLMGSFLRPLCREPPVLCEERDCALIGRVDGSWGSDHSPYVSVSQCPCSQLWGVPCPPSYLAPPVPEPLWGSVAFAIHGTFWPMPLHWHRGFPVFWHLPLLVCFWTIWAFICLVVSAEIHLVGASVAHHCLVVVYLGGRRRHLKTRSPVLHLV